MGSMLNAASTEEVFKMQKACTRLVNKKKKNAATNILFKTNKILKLPDVINLELIKYGLKLSRQDLPSPIEGIMNDKGGKKTHRYPMHNKAIPNIQIHKCTQFNNTYLCKDVSVLSASKDCIKGAQHLSICIKEY